MNPSYGSNKQWGNDNFLKTFWLSRRESQYVVANQTHARPFIRFVFRRINKYLPEKIKYKKKRNILEWFSHSIVYAFIPPNHSISRMFGSMPRNSSINSGSTLQKGRSRCHCHRNLPKISGPRSPRIRHFSPSPLAVPLSRKSVPILPKPFTSHRLRTTPSGQQVHPPSLIPWRCSVRLCFGIAVRSSSSTFSFSGLIFWLRGVPVRFRSPFREAGETGVFVFGLIMVWRNRCN